MSWFIAALKKYTVFSGRARRKEYWMFYLFMIIFYVVGGILDAAVGSHGIFMIIVALFFVIPAISVTVRRLHDTGRSGWWYWILAVPLVGTIVFLIFMVKAGTCGENDYGADPKDISVLS